MRLNDRVDILAPTMVLDPYSGETAANWAQPITIATNVPAEVSFTTIATIVTADRNALVEELRAIIEPRAFDPALNRLRWRGNTYTTNGPPMIRRRAGVDHHLTIPMKLVTG